MTVMPAQATGCPVCGSKHLTALVATDTMAETACCGTRIPRAAYDEAQAELHRRQSEVRRASRTPLTTELLLAALHSTPGIAAVRRAVALHLRHGAGDLWSDAEIVAAVDAAFPRQAKARRPAAEVH